jgi:hypothetical protein
MSRNAWLAAYLVLSGFVFLLVAVFHLLRLIYQWPILVSTQTIPFWLSCVGLPASSAYCVWAVWLFRKERKG